jgi:hypothetical protein
MSNLYTEPSKDASYQVSIHLAKWFQSIYKDCSFIFRSINKHGHHRPFLFLIGLLLNIFSDDQNLVGSTYRRFCIKFPQSWMKNDFLEINQSETKIAYGGHVC